jgi:peptide/nickel transport system permease protein
VSARTSEETGAGPGREDLPSLTLWVVKRLALSVLILFGVSILVFAATQALPGDPAQQILGHAAAPDQIAALRHRLGLDRSLVSQYLHWLRRVLHGSLGDSLSSPESVSSVITGRGLNSLALVVCSAGIAIPLSLLLGTYAAVRRDRAFDHGSQIVLLVLAAVPEFVLGLALLIVFATSVFTWLPAVALIAPEDNAFHHLHELALPVFTLVLAVVPYLARLQRAAMIDVLESEYVQMARLKGLPEHMVIRRHALRNAVVPIIQGSALTLIYLTGGVVVIEYLFAFPGLGSALATAVEGRDVPVVQAIVLVFAASYVIFNLLADILTVYVSPSLRTRFRR